VFSFSTEFRLPSRAEAKAQAQRSSMVVRTGCVVVLVDRGHAGSSAYCEVGGLVDEASDLDEIEENCRIDRTRSGSIVIRICEALEDLGRQLQPWPVEG